MEGNNATIYKVGRDSEPGSYYEVTFFDEGWATCECPSYKYSRTSTCKHIERVKSQGGGYKAPAPTVKVFQFTHGDHTAVLADNVGDIEVGIKEALKVLGVNNELVVKRIV